MYLFATKINTKLIKSGEYNNVEVYCTVLDRINNIMFSPALITFYLAHYILPEILSDDALLAE